MICLIQKSFYALKFQIGYEFIIIYTVVVITTLFDGNRICFSSVSVHDDKLDVST